jgi:aspartyl-tRNA(Asn)/glutamyl-tRNA(Gln) amidotransferase subunit B
MEYRPTIGLEIHAELKTRTKMFCACRNNPDEATPNFNICPVCMAHPGSLPVINKEAVRKVLLMGTALGSRLSDYTEFDRKNYFYPDIPKGYQISQYKYPLVSGGKLQGVEITRIHLEEDTARSQHAGERSLVDFNRAGVPLMELVTEPVIHDAEVAGAFARELQLLLRYLGAGEANMEKGEMRVEANISVSSTDTFGTKVEVKNLNSFRSVERAIAYEVERQIKLLERGEQVIQETRGWDENKQSTFSQRKKESSHDYRYFPDPDLPKLVISEIPEFSVENLKKEIAGHLPWEKREEYIALGLKAEDAEMFVREPAFGRFFDAVRTIDQSVATLATSYISSDLAGKMQSGDLKPEWFEQSENVAHFTKLLQMIRANELSSRGAKDILSILIKDGGDPVTISKEKGLTQQSDSSVLEGVVHKVIESHPQVAADFKAGKEAALQFLVGQGMKESKGAANPGVLKEVFIKALK